jgi:hypothetical protein
VSCLVLPSLILSFLSTTLVWVESVSFIIFVFICPSVRSVLVISLCVPTFVLYLSMYLRVCETGSRVAGAFGFVDLCEVLLALFCFVSPCLIVSRLVVACVVLSCLVLCCLVLSRVALCYLVLFCVVLFLPCVFLMLSLPRDRGFLCCFVCLVLSCDCVVLYCLVSPYLVLWSSCLVVVLSCGRLVLRSSCLEVLLFCGCLVVVLLACVV